MKVLKFGGKSLANGTPLNNAIKIIKTTLEKSQATIVVSGRNDATDELIYLLETAKKGKDFSFELNQFFKYQKEPVPLIDFTDEYHLLSKLLEGVKLLKEYTPKTKDEVLAVGELISSKMVSEILNQNGIKSINIDSRRFLKSDNNFGEARIDHEISNKLVNELLSKLNHDEVPIITGFIASNYNNETTTLGRNASNYTASLIANFINADELQNFTHVDGIYTADPSEVEDAKVIDQISYREANELASFGANVIHAKTITPLAEKNIPLRILNTLNYNAKGTLITQRVQKDGVKSIAVKKDVAVIYLEGKNFIGKIGVDAKIFNALNHVGVNVNVITQGSSERSISLVINENDVEKSLIALNQAFINEIALNEIQEIKAVSNIANITVIGQKLNAFQNSIKALETNQIEPLLINNTLHGKNISLVIHQSDLKKAVNLIHAQIFGVEKSYNVVVFGKGTVGGVFIDQVIAQKKALKKKGVELKIVGVTGTSRSVISKNGLDSDWRNQFVDEAFTVEDIITWTKKEQLENLIAIDNTASEDFVNSYERLVKNNFDLISSNKIANTQSYDQYLGLRGILDQYKKQYLYETNVGAGLPLIDTIKLLHQSGENITKIKGVFSGSLSFLFNSFSVSNSSFSEVLKRAIDSGYTEPDPREDLGGKDVARKLLILARELELKNEFEDIHIHNLIPEDLREVSKEYFLQNLNALDQTYQELKNNLNENQVFRYVGELSGDLRTEKGTLKVDLVTADKNSSLGQLSGSDSIFEIYTESYGDNPIIIQGAGAGAEVTARGVFGDLLRLVNSK